MVMFSFVYSKNGRSLRPPTFLQTAVTAQSKILDQSIAWHTHSSEVLHIHLQVLDPPPDHTEYFLRAIYLSEYVS